MTSLKLGTLVVASLFAMNSFAQNRKARTIQPKVEKTEQVERTKMTPEEKAKVQTDRLSEKLQLTEDQKNKAYEINLGVNMKNSAVRVDNNLTNEQRKEILVANNNGRNYLIGQLLNEDQKAKWDAMIEKREAQKAARISEKEGISIEEELEILED